MLLDEHELHSLAPLRLQPILRAQRQRPSDFDSVDKGLGLEFADYQPFQPGDDIRHVDWNHFHKDGRLVVRKYDQHETVTVHLMIDLSESMACLDRAKPEAVKRLCAAIAFCLLNNGAKAVLHPIGDEDRQRRFFGIRQWQDCMGAIEALPVGGSQDLAGEVQQFCYKNPRKDHLVILSDFLVENDGEALELDLAYLHSRAVLIHPTCTAELDPSLEGGLTLVEAESSRTASITVDRHIIASYQNEYRRYYQNLREQAEYHACRYHEIACGDPLNLQMEALAPNGVLTL